MLKQNPDPLRGESRPLCQAQRGFSLAPAAAVVAAGGTGELAGPPSQHAELAAADSRRFAAATAALAARTAAACGSPAAWTRAAHSNKNAPHKLVIIW